MPIRLPSYLHRNRCGVLGFRVVIPSDLRLFFPAKEYRLSLRTSALSDAKLIAQCLAGFVNQHFGKTRIMRGLGMENQNNAFLKLLADERARLKQHGDTIKALDGAEVAALVEFAADTLDDEIPGVGEVLRQLSSRQKAIDQERSALAAEGLATAIQADDADIDSHFCDLHSKLHGLKQKEAELREDFDLLRHQVMSIRAKLEHHTELRAVTERAKLDQERITDLASDLIVKAAAKLERAPAAHETKPSSAKLLSAVVRAYCDDQKAEGKWTAKTEAENQAIYALWLRIVPDRPIGSYDYEIHRRYKATLQRLPSNLNKNPRYRDKSIEEVLALADKPAALNTVNKHLVRIAALFKWAVRHGYASTNPAEGMVMRNPKRASEERQAFTRNDLDKLFQSPEYRSGAHLHPYMHWIPLIALYTGARLNEIAQLHLADFDTLTGIPVISINEEGEGKRLKTKAGKRIIPIHPELQRLGLIKYVDALREQGNTRLFPELKQGRDGYGQTVSKWFARYRVRCGITEPGKVFHSFRHTFIDHLKQKSAAKEKIAALVGHEDESETFGRYGKTFETPALLDVIRLLDFPSTHNLTNKP
jgi:integrase